MTIRKVAALQNFCFLFLNVMFITSGGQQVTSSSEPNEADEKSSWSDTVKTAGIIGALLTSLAVLGILVVLVFIARHQRAGPDHPDVLPAKPFQHHYMQFQTHPATAPAVQEMPTSFMPHDRTQASGLGTQLGPAPAAGPGRAAKTAAADSTFEPVSFSESATLIPDAKKYAENLSASRQETDTPRTDGGVYSTALLAAPSSTQQYFVNYSFDGHTPAPGASYSSLQQGGTQAEPEGEEYLYAQLVKSKKEDYIVVPEDIFTEKF